jgi:hypothetical protein
VATLPWDDFSVQRFSDAVDAFSHKKLEVGRAWYFRAWFYFGLFWAWKIYFIIRALFGLGLWVLFSKKAKPELRARAQAQPTSTTKVRVHQEKKATTIVFYTEIRDTIPCRFLLQTGSNTTSVLGITHHFPTSSIEHLILSLKSNLAVHSLLTLS